MVDDKGKPLFHANWRTLIVNHRGRRKTYTFGTNRLFAQKQADMLETREREIRNGIRPRPTIDKKYELRPFDDVCQEYYAWGNARGGRRNMPWDADFAEKKKRALTYWRTRLGLERLRDLRDVLPKVEAICHQMLADGKTGKTVSNTVQSLTSFIKWCLKRKYLLDDPLAELGKFDISPQTIRRAMTPDELRALLTYCAVHRRLLYEVAFCSGLRENELRQLEPHMLDPEECAIRIPKHIDKGRKDRLQYIPAALMTRLLEFAESGEALEIYKQTNRGRARTGKKKPPKNPLLYVPTNSATMLKRDLAAAGIEAMTTKGKLDFHALRTAYINFVIDIAPDVKTAQELARHETVNMTMNVYGRAKEERCRAVVESVGSLVFSDE